MLPQSTPARALPVVALVVIFVVLCGASFTRESAVWDEPHHLVSGYTALTLGDYRLDPEHPPLLRMWAAMALLGDDDVRLDLSRESWRRGDAYDFGHEFLYLDNDADALLYRARWMTVTLGVGLGLLLFAWARELFGYGPALGVLALYTLEPNGLAHARLVTTDFGVALFMTGSVYFLWRTTRRFTWTDTLLAGVGAGLAIASKYSALILGPIFLLLLLPALGRGRPWPGTAFDESTRGRVLRVASVLGAASLVVWLAIWAVFGFRYAPTSAPPDEFRFVTSSADWVVDEAPVLASVVERIDRFRLLPNAATQGFLFGQLGTRHRSAYLAGDYRLDGWWYFFPVSMLLKTPLTTLLLALGGLTLALREWGRRGADLHFLVTPAAVFMSVAMLTGLNIGIRHVLPVYPALLLLSGPAWSWLAARKRRLAGVVLGLAALEAAWVYPHPLASFNLLAGGPSRGHRYLLDSNLDWGQDLKGLAGWMRRNGVERINLGYFGTADPGYYGIEATYLPGGPFFVEERVAAPRLPGYVAVSATILHGVYLDDAGRAFYAPLRERDPITVIGHSIHVYRVEQPWWDGRTRAPG